MEPIVEVVASRRPHFRAVWENTQVQVWETAELSPHWDDKLIAGGLLGEAGRAPIAMVWSLECNEDWTVARFRAIPHDPRNWSPSELHLRYDGERRWWDDHDRELNLDTRDAPFVGWREGAAWHTPVLLHIGLAAREPVEIEVLQVNLANGALRAVPHRYTPLGHGVWEVYDSNYDDVATLRIDADGLVQDISGRLRRLR
jgi:hypothetical protein